MPTQYTSILKLALPVEGELDGTWGDVVNDSITSMVEQAVAGAATITTWTANVHTLTTANGATSEARCAVLIIQTGAGGTALTAAGQVICPTATKLYVLKNDSAYTVTLKTAAGSGIAVLAGAALLLFCDGTNVQSTGVSINDVSGLAAGIATFLTTPTSANLRAAVTDETGTGALVFANSPALTSPTFSGGTANGVLYLNGSLVATSGSALTFDGTYFTANGLRLAGTDLTNTIYQATGALGISTGSASGITFATNSTTRMALDASGNLGIGTTSPTRKLEVVGSAAALAMSVQTTGAGEVARFSDGTAQTLILGTTASGVYYNNANSGLHAWLIGGTERMRLDASGNLGIGTTSPTTKLHVSSTATEVIFQDSDTAKAASLTALLSLHGSDGRAGYVGYPADSSLYINNQNNTPMLFLTNNVERMRLDSSGNLGLGVTPSAWSGMRAVELTSQTVTGSIAASGGAMYVNNNCFWNGSNWIYTGTGYATQQAQAVATGAHVWNLASSGTAGNTIAFTQAMTLDSSGNLGIGTASPTQKLDVNGTAKATTFSGSASGLTGLPLSTGVTGTLPIANGGTGSTSTTYCALGSNVSGTLPVVNGGTGVTTSTGTGSTVLSTSPVLVTPSLGTPTALTLTSATGLPLTTGVTGTLPIANGGTGSTSTTYCALGSNVSGTLPVANGGTGVTTSTGTGDTVRSTSPVLVTPNLGTPTVLTLTSATGLPLTTGVTGTLPIANGGTGSTSTTYCALGSNVSGTLPVVNGGTGVTTSTGTGSTVLSTSPTLTTPALGAATATTPTAGANGTGVATTAFVQNRAWVNLNGLGSGDLRRGNWNVGSVTDNGTGDYTINFATGMVDTNYATIVTSTTNAGANAGFYGGIYPGGTYTTSAVQVAVHQSAVGFFDAATVCVAVFR